MRRTVLNIIVKFQKNEEGVEGWGVKQYGALRKMEVPPRKKN